MNSRPSLPGNGAALGSIAEELITEAFYRKNAAERRRAAYAYGLQSPLWWWSTTATVEKEQERAFHLISWLLLHKPHGGSIGVLLPVSWTAEMKERVDAKLRHPLSFQRESTRVHIMPHHELTLQSTVEGERPTYDVVVYCFGAKPSVSSIERIVDHEQWVTSAMAAASSAFILSSDVGWTAPAVCMRSPQWKLLVEKMGHENFPISSDKPQSLPSEDRLPALMGKAIPLCCSRHPNQRQLEYGVQGIELKCQRYCLHPFSCQQANHVCLERCHGSSLHQLECPYRCEKALPCGHSCMKTCSEPCDCLHLMEKTLNCSHELVIGLDRESSEPIYVNVPHVFRGHCEHASRSCCAAVPTECAKCSASLTRMCFEVTELNHTRYHKTLVCDSCQRVQRDLKADLLGRILCEKEQTRKKLRIEMTRAHHQQHKAAQQGLFSPGERVEIVNAMRCVPPLIEDDFPGIQFIDLDEPTARAVLQGTYGTFVSTHVDMLDVGEMRHLVRLPSGLHTLVADGGLRLIRVAALHSIKAAQTLLLSYEGPPSSPSAVESLEHSDLVGKLMYVSIPVVHDGVSWSDCVGTVRGADPANSNHIFLDIYSFSVHTEELADTPTRVVSIPDSPMHELHTTISAPLAALEPLDGFEVGKQVYVVAPEHQVRDTALLSMIVDIAQYKLQNASLMLSAARMQANKPYTVVMVINAPFISDRYKSSGPILVVNGSVQSSSWRRPGEDAPLLYFAVPYMFTKADEEAEAEATLDSAAQRAFQNQLAEQLEKQYDDLSYRNNEATYYQLEQMPPVTAEMKERKRTAYSEPVGLPSQQELAALKQRHIDMPIVTSEKVMRSELLDRLEQRKEESSLNGRWVSSLADRIRKDGETDALHIATLALGDVKKGK